MHILLIGKTGQLGWELQRTLAPLALKRLTAIDYPEIDLTRPDQLQTLLREVQPQVIVNAAAYTAVDRAESEVEAALAVNALAPQVMAEEARRLNAVLIHYSTDYVFDGTKGAPYVETDRPNPLNAYGRSKLAGEQAIQQVGGAYLILRTSWVYSLRRSSFVTKVLGWARQHETLRVVDDQIANPTWCRMLAEASAQLLAMAGEDVYGWVRARRGLYHLAAPDSASRFAWAKAILHYDPHPEEQVTREVLPAKTAEFPAPATRPANSSLNCERFSAVFGMRLPPWEASLQLAMIKGCTSLWGQDR